MPLKILLSIAIRSAGVAANFLIAWILIKKFGRDEAGVYFLLSAIFFFSAPIIRFGTDEIILRETSRSKDPNSNKVVSLYRVFLSINSIVTVILALLIFFLELWSFRFNALSEVPFVGSTVLCVLAASVYNLSYNLGKIAQGMGRFNSSISIFSFLPNMLILFLILLIPWQPSSTAALYFLIMAFLVFLYAIYTFRHYSQYFGFGNISEAIKMKWTLVSICVSSTYANGSLHLQTFFLSFVVSLSDFTVFSILLRFASIFLLVISFVGHFFAPRIANAFWKSDYGRLRLEFLKGSALLAAVNMLIFVILISCSDFFLSIFDISATKWSTEYFFLMLAFLLHGATGLLGTFLIMTGREEIVLWNTILAFILTAVGILTMGFSYGALGGILTILFTIFIQKSVLFFFVYKALFLSSNEKISDS